MTIAVDLGCKATKQTKQNQTFGIDSAIVKTPKLFSSRLPNYCKSDLEVIDEHTHFFFWNEFTEFACQ